MFQTLTAEEITKCTDLLQSDDGSHSCICLVTYNKFENEGNICGTENQCDRKEINVLVSFIQQSAQCRTRGRSEVPHCILRIVSVFMIALVIANQMF